MSIVHPIADSLAELTVSDEPFFVLRASDALALYSLRVHQRNRAALLGQQDQTVRQLHELEAQFETWQHTNPDKLQPLEENWP